MALIVEQQLPILNLHYELELHIRFLFYHCCCGQYQFSLRALRNCTNYTTSWIIVQIITENDKDPSLEIWLADKRSVDYGLGCKKYTFVVAKLRKFSDLLDTLAHGSLAERKWILITLLIAHLI